MKYPSFSEQPNTDPGTLPCAELSAELFEKGLDVIPGYVTTYRPAKNQCQCFTMFSLHDCMVLYFSTINKDKYIYLACPPYKTLAGGKSQRHQGYLYYSFFVSWCLSVLVAIKKAGDIPGLMN